MIKRIDLTELDDYFLDLGKRNTKGVYFYRINGYNQTIFEFLQCYYEEARRNGVIIEGKLKNPDNNNLAYYNEIMGAQFQMDKGFISKSLRKWLPRMSTSQRESVAGAIYETLLDLRCAGKNDNMLKNAYIKFMCWLYYRFERIVNQLGNEKLPKILYDGTIGNYDLLLMNVLSGAGCDIVLLQYNGDADYLKIDPTSTMSRKLAIQGMTSFPPGFSLKFIRDEIQRAFNREKLYGEKPSLKNCTNAWISGKIFDDVRKETGKRGNDQRFFYNCFCRIMGVEDRLTYQNELYQLQLELKNSRRKVVILNNSIAPPTLDEIHKIHRKNYQNLDQIVMDLSAKILYPANQELQKIMKTAFVDLMLDEGKKTDNLNRLTNRAVYLICWLKRYQPILFDNWKPPEIGVFFYLGGCQNENESLFCRFLARIPVDVLIFNPNLNQKCCLCDDLLYEVNYDNSLVVTEFPEENTGLRVATAAYHAERDLDTLMYQDTGIYRSQQYIKANSISLQTMYEEIAILWDQELKYRPNFSTTEDVVNIPVIFSKICGVKNGDLQKYWREIKTLLTPDTTLIKQVPNITQATPNPMRGYSAEFFRNGRLQKGKIKQHKAYQYGFLRESMQDYILDKLQFMIEQRMIKGTFENGTEYTIIATALNIDKNILRQIQRFDFTKKNPKLIYIITGETMLSLEDAIYVAFLNLLGFDILFFVPTGYQCIEQHFTRCTAEEHQIGEYIYDLRVPDFDTIPAIENTRQNRRGLLFRRRI